MPSLFLTEHIKSNIFIQDLNKKLFNRDVSFDLIISDLNYVDCSILCINPENKPKNISLLNAWKDAISVSKHPLIILNELNINFLEPIFKTLKNKKYATIINTYAWLWSYWKKISPETNDLDYVHKLNFHSFEPIDLENMRNILKQNQKQYIRLLHKEMPDAIFDVDELGIIDASMLESLDSISLKTYGFTGSDGVILATGNLFSTAIQTWEIIQNNNKQVSIFILQNLNSNWNEEIINNIKNSKKLFILIDHNDGEDLKERIRYNIKNFGLNNIELNIISPKYNKLTTVLNEYQEEQTDFSPEKLAQRIIQKL